MVSRHKYPLGLPSRGCPGCPSPFSLQCACAPCLPRRLARVHTRLLPQGKYTFCTDKAVPEKRGTGGRAFPEPLYRSCESISRTEVRRQKSIRPLKLHHTAGVSIADTASDAASSNSFRTFCEASVSCGLSPLSITRLKSSMASS